MRFAYSCAFDYIRVRADQGGLSEKMLLRACGEAISGLGK